MRSALAVLATAGALALAPAAAQAADFPEQPGDATATACAKLLNVGTATAFGTPAPGDGVANDGAESQVTELYVDACNLE